MSKQSTRCSRKFSSVLLVTVGQREPVPALVLKSSFFFSLAHTHLQHVLTHGTESLAVWGRKKTTHTDNKSWPCKPARRDQREGGLPSRRPKRRLTWIWGAIISMQRDQSCVSLYGPEACYSKALTIPKTLLSPNGVETKETAKSGCTESERKGALTQRLAKISSCFRSNRQAWLSTLTLVSVPLPSLSLCLAFCHYSLCVVSMPVIKYSLPPRTQVCKQTGRSQKRNNRNALRRPADVISSRLCRDTTQHLALHGNRKV